MNTFEQTFEHDTMASSLNQHTRETISPDISLRREEDSAEEKSFKETGQMR